MLFIFLGLFLVLLLKFFSFFSFLAGLVSPGLDLLEQSSLLRIIFIASDRRDGLLRWFLLLNCLIIFIETYQIFVGILGRNFSTLSTFDLCLFFLGLLFLSSKPTPCPFSSSCTWRYLYLGLLVFDCILSLAFVLNSIFAFAYDFHFRRLFFRYIAANSAEYSLSPGQSIWFGKAWDFLFDNMFISLTA